MTDPKQSTGFLATECPTCQGNGRVSWLQGMEQLSYSADCDDCRGTGWEVDIETPAISVRRAFQLIYLAACDSDDLHGHQDGLNEALAFLSDRIKDEFEEAR